MITNLNCILEMLLHQWLNGDIIKDFYLFELYVKLSKLSYNNMNNS